MPNPDLRVVQSLCKVDIDLYRCSLELPHLSHGSLSYEGNDQPHEHSTLGKYSSLIISIHSSSGLIPYTLHMLHSRTNARCRRSLTNPACQPATTNGDVTPVMRSFWAAAMLYGDSSGVCDNGAPLTLLS
ncbi:hypothetical protein FOMG_08628 [Fusarium oxysporum f. sp. melonis 26406]|uniref:Uncharacterized protein n=1 Tax=Fusarium oxysporum f. sp. melonis 26406 TaxID=1089452 RepID=X0AYW3_FUSOX|nr:hypothetical protein FOMG_08628 [Fusarium oxysporum f. sp. melonis 26406]